MAQNGGVSSAHRLRLYGYDGWLSIEHEDIVLSRIEGMRRSVDLLERVLIGEPTRLCNARSLPVVDAPATSRGARCTHVTLICPPKRGEADGSISRGRQAFPFAARR